MRQLESLADIGPKRSNAQDLRSELRVPVHNQLAEVIVLRKGSPRMSCSITDISRSGIGLVLEHYLPEGTWIKLKIGQVVIFGHTRYCRRQPEGGYRVGLISDTVITTPSS